MKLTRFEHRWAQATLRAMFPGSRDEGFVDIADMDVHGYLVEVMRSLPFKARLGLRAAVWLVAFAPLVVLGRLATIRRLAPADAERVVATLCASPSYAVRSLVMLLKTFGALLYAGDDGVRARLRPAVATTPATSMTVVPLRIRRAHVA
jgi:hypothetical protein